MSIRLFGEPDSDHAGDALHDFYTRDDLLDGGDFAEMFTPAPLRRRAIGHWPCGCLFSTSEATGYVHRCSPTPDQPKPEVKDV